MADGRWQRVKDVFDAALERAAGERAAFIAQACAGDGRLEDEVQSLLVAHEEAGNFLSGPALAALDPDLTGRRVGPYRVLGEIGHGGTVPVGRISGSLDGVLTCRRSGSSREARAGSGTSWRRPSSPPATGWWRRRAGPRIWRRSWPWVATPRP